MPVSSLAPLLPEPLLGRKTMENEILLNRRKNLRDDGHLQAPLYAYVHAAGDG